jgi:beta-glucosidase
LTTFPANFLWGAATSAYQVEGSPLADGAGENIWHRFSHTPGRIADHSNGDLACDHYRRYGGDVALMREFGFNSYRFSISWSRVLPEGVGRVNQAGVDFYNRLTDALLENQIEPMVTLYHWDLPQSLEDRGGWADRRSIDWFAEYAQVMYRTLGDRVRLWTTFNEPWVIVDQGYVEGRHAPGRRSREEAATVSKNLLLAHAAAVEAYRSVAKHNIGIVLNLVPIFPASATDADRQAAGRLDAYFNRQFLDPLFLGTVPSELREMFGPAWPEWTTDELQRVRQPIDYVGVNYYLRLVVCDDPSSGAGRARSVRQPNCRYTAMEWEIFPEGLTQILQWLKQRYGNVPLYITENGAAFDDVPLPNGAINDIERVQYLNDHLRAAAQALEAGVNLRGYYVWSLLDNFEWQCGYSKRFGIVHVDFETQRRNPKNSARFYSDVIRSAGAVITG